ncbi:MAG: hypothetical protein E6K82_15160 [Candidatus Rokuibacteriota bacterium]|nr:MAG: hypothetical protein E6K82_15160 [Candidatus Rokubacteria bacterium]
MTRLWIGTLRHHFPADFTAMWGAGRLRGGGRDPYFDPVFVDVGGLALVALGDVFVPFLPRRVAARRPILGLLVLWVVLTVTLVTLP